MQRIFVLGNLTREPELSETQNGTAVCRFTVAVNRTRTEGVDYFNCVAWRGLAETCGKYLKKGKKVSVVGTIQFRDYEDKNGVKRTVADVMADEVEFLSPAEEKLQNGKREVKGKQQRLEAVDEDLPF